VAPLELEETKKVLADRYSVIKPIAALFAETFFFVQQAQAGKLELTKVCNFFFPSGW
jgi:hypothetical protein